MSDKYFPIKQSPACQLKWAWSTIRLYEGSTSSCHRVEKEVINQLELKKLLVYLTELDRRRVTNWRKTFPWLTNILETV